jgi:hypothetical protein
VYLGVNTSPVRTPADNIKELNRIQVITRLRKLLGFDIQIDFGSFDQFESRISQMVGIQRKVQKFGNWY